MNEFQGFCLEEGGYVGFSVSRFVVEFLIFYISIILYPYIVFISFP